MSRSIVGPPHRRRLFLSVVVLLALLVVLPAAAPVARAQGDSHLFPETGHTVSGAFWAYWQANGGLAQQGYPLSEQVQQQSTLDGQTYTAQYFERAVFELHPENQAPYNVLLAQLGRFAYEARYGKAGAPGQQVSSDNPRYFAETGFTIGGRFRAYWESNGGLAQQGYPISNEFQERNPLDGKTYRVQYFERAVFEYHPDNKPPYDVLLSQLGRYQLAINLAAQSAAKLASPPRIYNQGPGGGPAAWPVQPGSTDQVYQTCGARPGPPIEGQPGAGTCRDTMTLTTSLVPNGADWEVTFSSSWSQGKQKHDWKLRVSADGLVTFLGEDGDMLPPFPV